MAQPVVNAAQVAAAYSVPLAGVGQSLMYYDQLNEQRRQRDYALRQQNDARNVGILEDAFKGLDVATGTPMDEVTPAHVNAAKRQLMDYMAKNPNAPATELWQQGQRATAGIANGISQAKKVAALVDDYVKRGSAEYPQIDQTLFKNYLLNSAFRDPKTREVLTTPNLNFYSGNELTDPEMRASFANPAALAQGVQKELAENYKPVAWMEAQPDGTLFRGKARPYQNRQGEFLTEPVMWRNNDIPVMSPSALMGGNGDRIPAQGFIQQMQGVPADLLNTLKARPMFQDALVAERRRLMKQHPDMIKGASADQVDQLAAANLLQNYGSKDGFEPAKTDFTIVDHMDKKRHQRFQEAISAQNLSLNRARFGLAQSEAARRAQKDAQTQADKKAKILDTVPGILYTASLDPREHPELAASIANKQAIIQNNQKLVNIGGVQRKATDLTSMHGKPTVLPGTKTPVKLNLIDLGPGMGQALQEVPQVYNKAIRQWVDDPKNITLYMEQSANQELQPQLWNFGGNFKIEKKSPFARIEQYDRQWNEGQKPNHESELSAVDESYDDISDEAE